METLQSPAITPVKPVYPGLTAPKFLPGQSGNPKGRAPFSVALDKRPGLSDDRLAEELERLVLYAKNEAVRLGAINRVHDLRHGPISTQLNITKTSFSFSFQLVEHGLDMLEATVADHQELGSRHNGY